MRYIIPLALLFLALPVRAAEPKTARDLETRPRRVPVRGRAAGTGFPVDGRGPFGGPETITMRDTSRHWHRWRVTLNGPAANRFGCLRTPEPATAGASEQPGPDGIRHGLVARVRAEIAAGTYDTEEKWLAAEEALLRRIEERL